VSSAPTSWATLRLRGYGPLVEPSWGRDTKDPCPVFDGTCWHLYGSTGSVVVEQWRLLHATANHLSGPWVEHRPVELVGVTSERIAAPGVTVENGVLHMFVQTDFMELGGTLEHLVSDDGGTTFVRHDTAVRGDVDQGEAGLFDAHPVEIAGTKYLVYAAMAQDLTGLRWEPERFYESVRGPDIHLAVSGSGTWNGPWRRLGPILRQEDVPYQSKPGHPDYEWGLEGPQVIELPDGRVLLLAVCFRPGFRRGNRQRLFAAVSDDIFGPYRAIGMPVQPGGDSWQSGEVGHGTLVPHERDLWIFYQARSVRVGADDEGEARWRFGTACWPLAGLLADGGPLAP
jgi:hypothetical protein